MREKFRDASISLEKNLYDVDASWNFWIHENTVYAIPYGRYKHEALELEFVEEYSYWNNTDPPDGISEEEFYERGKVWKKVCLDDWNGLRLSHTVVNFSNPESYADLLAQEYLGIL